MFITLIVIVLILLVQCNIFMIVDANGNVDDILDHRPRRNLKRLAMLWTIERSPGFYCDFALSSFIGSGADMVMCLNISLFFLQILIK